MKVQWQVTLLTYNKREFLCLNEIFDLFDKPFLLGAYSAPITIKTASACIRN